MMNKAQEVKHLIQQVMDPNMQPSKVPLFLNMQGWIVYQAAGYGYEEAIYDSDKILDAYEKCVEQFPAEIYYDMGGFSSMFFSKCLGSQDFFLNEEKYSLNFKDVAYLESKEDYALIAKDPENFLWNKFYKNKFRNLAPETTKDTIKAYMQAAQTHFEKCAITKQRIIDKHGTLFLSDVPMYQSAFDYMFQYIIGMKTVSMDMRRNKDALLGALNGFEDLFVRYMKEQTPPCDPVDMPLQMQICTLGHTITNPRQFEQFIRPHMTKIVDWFAEHNMKFLLLSQGNAGPLLDFLDYIPADLCCIFMEVETLSDLKARYGNKFTYAGGMPVSVLGNATMAECEAFTRNVLEEHGHDGNLIFTTNKSINYQCDAKVDNLKMVCDVVGNFKP